MWVSCWSVGWISLHLQTINHRRRSELMKKRASHRNDLVILLYEGSSILFGPFSVSFVINMLN
uniref:Uncharacterized protein n=1 Tax=Cannabis sativa TaxID=3483 RepID=A0A803R7R5_CANSA